MVEDLPNQMDIAPALSEPTAHGAPQVMEPDVFDAGVMPYLTPCLRDVDEMLTFLLAR